MLTGVYLATKKDKTVYYRSNITHKGRHISLGSFPTEVQAHQAVQEQVDIHQPDILLHLQVEIWKLVYYQLHII